MSLPDATAAAAIDSANIKPIWLVYLDILGDPVRANSSGAALTIAGSGQPDLDGDYIGIDPKLVALSSLKSQPGGSDMRWIRLSGIRGIDDATRTLLANPANWQGRLVRRWQIIRDVNNVQQGGVRHIDTGYMMGLSHIGSVASLTIELTYESYLAAFGKASGRTYLAQDSFDELDKSAQAALAIASGNMGSALTSGAGGAGGKGGGVGALPKQVYQ